MTTLGWSQQSTDQDFEITRTPIPEPTTLLLFGTGLAAVAVRMRRGKRI